MLQPNAIPLPRRPELVVRPLGDAGDHVVKDTNTGAYFNFGPQEAFLLDQLDGKRTVEVICTAFAERFGEALPAEDLEDFLTMALGQGFLRLRFRTGKAAQVLEFRDVSNLTQARLL